MADQSERGVRCTCRCGAHLKVPPAALGRKAKCPKCSTVMILRADESAAGDATSTPPSAAERLSVGCACGARLRVPASARGRRVRCPRCGAAIAVAAAPRAPVEQHADQVNELLAGLASGEVVSAPEAYDVAARETPGDTDETTPRKGKLTRKCPSCGTTYPEEAVICPPCGVNLKTGRALLTTQDENVDEAYTYAENVITWLSWLIPLGVYPIASEAFGLRKPWVIRGIAAVTTLVSLWYMGAFLFNPDASPGLANLMLWSGEPAAADEQMSAEELIQSLREEGYTDEEIAEFQASEEQWMEAGQHRGRQLLTHALLHADPLHLAGNMLFLLVLGSRVNALIGNVLTLIFYPFLAVAAGVAHAISMAGEPIAPMLGASGAVMGLAGMYLVFFPVHQVHMVAWWRYFWFYLSYKLFAVRGFWVVLFYIAFDVLYTTIGLEDDVAHWAHLGGFLAGVGIALVLLVTRVVNARGGDLLTAVLGRHAWALLGKPNRPGWTLW